MTKRLCDDVKTWWEMTFDEGSYKFRKLNRHHDAQPAQDVQQPFVQGQQVPNGPPLQPDDGRDDDAVMLDANL
jgi:hypothetical protein